MILDCAKLLCEAAEEACENGVDIQVDIRMDYSGRGMYGSKTTGLVLQNNTRDLALLAAIAGKLSAEDPKRFEALCLGLRDLRIDSMGRDVIMY